MAFLDQFVVEVGALGEALGGLLPWRTSSRFDPDFSLLSRQKKLQSPVMDTDSIYAAARELLEKFPLAQGVRLTGVSVSGFATEDAQQALFVDETQKRRETLENLTAKLGDRFGEAGITRASLLDRGKPGRGKT